MGKGIYQHEKAFRGRGKHLKNDKTSFISQFDGKRYSLFPDVTGRYMVDTTENRKAMYVRMPDGKLASELHPDVLFELAIRQGMELAKLMKTDKPRAIRLWKYAHRVNCPEFGYPPYLEFIKLTSKRQKRALYH